MEANTPPVQFTDRGKSVTNGLLLGLTVVLLLIGED